MRLSSLLGAFRRWRCAKCGKFVPRRTVQEVSSPEDPRRPVTTGVCAEDGPTPVYLARWLRR